MFTTPNKFFTKLAQPYLSPLKLFGVAETTTVTPASSPSAYSVPPLSIPNPPLSALPPPRKHYGASRGPRSSPLKPRPFGRGYRRVSVQHTVSRQSLHIRRSIRNRQKAKATLDFQFKGLSRAAFDAARRARAPLNHEDRVFLKQLADLAITRHITTSLAQERTAVDRAAELAPRINAEREAKAQASLAREKEQRVLATQREAEIAAEAAAEQARLDTAKCRATARAIQQQLFKLRKQRQQEALHGRQQQLLDHPFHLFFHERRNEEIRQQAERDLLAQEDRHEVARAERDRLADEQEARRRDELAQAERDRLAREQEVRHRHEVAQAESDRLVRERETRRRDELALAERVRLAREQEVRRRHEVAQAEWDRLARERETRRCDEEIARLREEREAFRRMAEERIRLENERLIQEQRAAQAYIDAAIRFRQEAHERLQRAQTARLQAEYEVCAAQRTETAANDARAQWNSRDFNGMDVSMRDVSMLIDMDASMRTAAPYSPPPSPLPPPPPPPPTVEDRFALYERKWAALKSDVPLPVLSFGVLPWPILDDVSTPQDITEERMFEFFYHPGRPGYEDKTHKECNRIELLRWHPDKLLGTVLGKVDARDRTMIEETIGQVTRFLLDSAASY